MPIKLKEEDVILNLNNKYPEYDFSKFKYTGTYCEGIVVCPRHGEVTRKYKDLIRTNSACKFCACRYDTSAFLEKIVRNHPNDSADNYDFSNIVYSGITEKYEVFCRRHQGSFSQVGASLVQESSILICPVCNVKNRADTQYYDLDKFLSSIPDSQKDLDDFSDSKYLGSKLPIDIRCKAHDYVYTLRPNDYQQGTRCGKCSDSIKSKPQQELLETIRSWGIDAVSQDRSQLSEGREIDIFIPSKNIGVEYNGLFYHRKVDLRDPDGSLMASSTSLNEKSILARYRGIFLVHIFEDEWLLRRRAVENRLKSILGVSSRIYARNCDIRKVSLQECKEFEDKWHVQGHVRCPISLGLYSENTLVACMTFGKPRFSKASDGEFEMLRFCSSLSVVGGFSKLLKSFIRTYNPSKILSYSDKRWGVGNVYEKNGFIKTGESEPGFFWFKSQQRYNRMNFQRWKLNDMFEENFPDSMTADEILYSKGYKKIEDCGQLVWTLDLK